MVSNHIESECFIEPVKNYFLDLHASILKALQDEDGREPVIQDDWNQAEQGYGKTYCFKNGQFIESGGVNFSFVKKPALPESALGQNVRFVGCPFEATGVSIVIHPHNPYVPSVHCNVRFFNVFTSKTEGYWWFGGALDLTPYYGSIEDCQHWHKTIEAKCRPFGSEVYSDFKRQCDQYFYLPHRQEPRGIGGVFFDYLNTWRFEKCFEFIRSMGEVFLSGYLPIVKKQKSRSYGKREREFQLYRRGRYVEFNLLYDRGTRFGLHTGGRTESILVSLPAQVTWCYDYQPKEGTEEARLYKQFLIIRDWLSEE